MFLHSLPSLAQWVFQALGGGVFVTQVLAVKCFSKTGLGGSAPYIVRLEGIPVSSRDGRPPRCLRMSLEKAIINGILAICSTLKQPIYIHDYLIFIETQ